MNKLLLYKILFIANISISILLLAFIILYKPTGKPLFLIAALTALGILGALAMHNEIRKSGKIND